MPEVTRDNFQRRVNNLLRDYGELLLAVHSKTRQASLEIMVSEQAVMSLGVYWEAFVHDLMLAYIMRNPTSCVLDYKTRINQSLTAKFNVPSTWIKVNIPSQITLKHAERMVDPKGWNLDATSAEELRSKANQLLHSTDARNFSLSSDNAAFVDLVVAMRNYLAHRSTSSRRVFRASVRTLQTIGPNSRLASAPAADIGQYLKTTVSVGLRRVHVVGERLVDVSRVLVP
jgi:hypothetical protein